MIKLLDSYRLGLVLIALGSPAIVPNVAAATVPFEGEARGDVVGTPIRHSFKYAVELTGSGNASELGRFTVYATHITDGRTGAITGGSITFVAKNGDTLTGTYVGQEAPTDSPEVTSVAGTLTITGGTGRFQGASGTLPLTALVTIEEITAEGVFIETFTASFGGTLVLPHSE